MKGIKKALCAGGLALMMSVGSLATMAPVSEPVKVEASTKVKLNKKTLTLKKGATYKLKVKGTSKKVTWKSSKKKIATVSSNGKVTAKKVGKTVISAKVGGKTYKCKVTVKKKTTASNNTDTSRNVDVRAVEVFVLLNHERKAVGLPELQMDTTLNAAAYARAKELVQSFSHTRPNGTASYEILNESAYQYSWWTAGENIAGGQDSSAVVMADWMNSPGHKANILDKDYDSVGIACYYNPATEYRYYWVQIFAKAR